MAKLFTPLKIREIELKNRIAVSPMCEYSANDGFANDWHLVHLGSRAVGGAGLVIVEATAVSPEGRISPGDLGLWKDEHIDFLKRITDFIDANNSVAGIQLAHAGRKASKSRPWDGDAFLNPAQGGWQTVAPSPLPFDDKDGIPKELTIEEIGHVVADFKCAALRAIKAGFKVIELHGAHGYLINEFLSPLSNKRTDEFGGSFENRIRLLVRITEEVRNVWPAAYPLFVRISASDWAEGGWTIEDSVKLAGILKTKGVDLIDCSSGGLVKHAKITLGPGYQVPFSEAVKKETGVLTGAVGLITTSKQAEEIVSSGKADLVLLAREFLRDPYFPLHAATELGVELNWPKQYVRAKPHK